VQGKEIPIVDIDKTTGEVAIRTLVEGWAKAVRNRNLSGILANHSPDIVMFDVPPPLQSKGIEAYERTWALFYS
jgi:ketosteroid isomerase-like protein